MQFFHGSGKKTAYFEGWYFKQQQGQQAIAFIPGISINGQGGQNAFIQVVTPTATYQADYDAAAFNADNKKLQVRIGESYFSPKGAVLNIQRKHFTCQGRLTFENMIPLNYAAMGPFAFLPMACNHDVLSMSHRVDGVLTLNGKTMVFDGGKGYIEKDWGHSFPSRYMWVHCNDFPGNTSIMAAVADIPFGPASFRGCLVFVYHNGRIHRITTYNGGRVHVCSPKELIVSNSKYCLKVRLKQGESHPLSAPEVGRMSRTIKECLTGEGAFSWYVNGSQVFSHKSSQVSSEFVV